MDLLLLRAQHAAHREMAGRTEEFSLYARVARFTVGRWEREGLFDMMARALAAVRVLIQSPSYHINWQRSVN